MKFQKAVYSVIFGIRNLVRIEKEKRSEFYINMYKPKLKRDKSNSLNE